MNALEGWWWWDEISNIGLDISLALHKNASMNYLWLTILRMTPSLSFFSYYSNFWHVCTLTDITPNQMHQVTLDPIEKVKLTWMVDWPEKNVFFQLKNGINERFTWFAIGFSRRGDLPLTGEKKSWRRRKFCKRLNLSNYLLNHAPFPL